jgi:hypothetical protein
MGVGSPKAAAHHPAKHNNKCTSELGGRRRPPVTLALVHIPLAAQLTASQGGGTRVGQKVGAPARKAAQAVEEPAAGEDDMFATPQQHEQQEEMIDKTPTTTTLQDGSVRINSTCRNWVTAALSIQRLSPRT